MTLEVRGLSLARYDWRPLNGRQMPLLSDSRLGENVTLVSDRVECRTENQGPPRVTLRHVSNLPQWHGLCCVVYQE